MKWNIVLLVVSLALIIQAGRMNRETRKLVENCVAGEWRQR